MQFAPGHRGSGIEERPAEECEGKGLLRRGAGTAGGPHVVDLHRGLDGGDSRVGEGEEEAAFVLALVGVRLAIAAVEQAQPVVLDLHGGRSASTFFFPDPLVWVDLSSVEVVIEHKGLHGMRESACQDKQNDHAATEHNPHTSCPPRYRDADMLALYMTSTHMDGSWSITVILQDRKSTRL